jgi:hypothetical protein
VHLMLLTDSSKRASIPEICSHPWLSKHTASFYANASTPTYNNSSQGMSFFNIPSTPIMLPTDTVEEEHETLLEKKAIIESFQLKSAQSLLSFDANTSLSASSSGKSGSNSLSKKFSVDGEPLISTTSSSGKSGRHYAETPSNEIRKSLSNFFSADGESLTSTTNGNGSCLLRNSPPLGEIKINNANFAVSHNISRDLYYSTLLSQPIDSNAKLKVGGTVTPDDCPKLTLITASSDIHTCVNSDVESDCDDKPALFKLIPLKRRSLINTDHSSSGKNYGSDGDEPIDIKRHILFPPLEAVKVDLSADINKVKLRQANFRKAASFSTNGNESVKGRTRRASLEEDSRGNERKERTRRASLEENLRHSLKSSVPHRSSLNSNPADETLRR